MKSLIAPPALLLLLTACGAGPSVHVAFNPNPPRQGTQTLSITLTDAGGAPVKGAEVTVTTRMPAMAMSGPSGTASDNGDGTYTAHLSLQYATRWLFDITASSGGKTTRTEISRDVR